MIREQGGLPPAERRGALVVVDEMQSMPGVDYESMLSELGKFGASFVLATQSLAKLEDLSRTMQDTVLANIGCLAVFQVAGADARRLVWELGRERVSEDDITSLPVHHCYVRATVDGERVPAFSMMVRRPEPGRRRGSRSHPRRVRRIHHRGGDDRRRRGRAPAARRAVQGAAGGERGGRGARRRAGPAAGLEHAPPAQQKTAALRRGGNMRRTGCPDELLRWLAAMPLLDRLELAAVSGWSRGAVYDAVTALEDAGLSAAVPHATEDVPPTRRFHLTARGLRRLARQEGVALDALLRIRPVSAQWRRILLERLDAVAVMYRVAAAVANVARPTGFRWYRGMPLDAAMELTGGRTLGIVRLGPTVERTAFSRRLWRLVQGAPPGGLLVIVPDAVRLRHTRRLLDGLRLSAFLAVEGDAAAADADSRVWCSHPGGEAVSVRRALARLRSGGALPVERRQSQAALPEETVVDPLRRSGPRWLLPALLRPAEKRTLDLVADWPLIDQTALRRLLGVSGARAWRLAVSVERLGLAARSSAAGRTRWALTDRGLGLLSRRDRASVGAARKRWSVDLVRPGAPLTWRTVSGARSRQLLRNIDHTAAVHGFVGALAAQARSLGWTAQLDPPHRASRFFRYDGALHSVRPDAFGIVRTGGRGQPFFLEWERRAVRPVTMAERLAPYLRYYASRRPVDDHGAQPVLLVVFDHALSAVQFLRVARREMAASGVRVPLLVSDRATLAMAGPLGRVWLKPGGWERHHGFG